VTEANGHGVFDPYATLHELEAARAQYVVIGALARVMQGADEVTHGLDITPLENVDNMHAVTRALARMGAEMQPMDPPERNPGRITRFKSPRGPVAIVRVPAGTRGYEDLRRRAERLHIGEGLRPQVASAGDLVRMMEALGRAEHSRALDSMRRVVELDRGLGLER
jgi:hypothetical protein